MMGIFTYVNDVLLTCRVAEFAGPDLRWRIVARLCRFPTVSMLLLAGILSWTFPPIQIIHDLKLRLVHTDWYTDTESLLSECLASTCSIICYASFPASESSSPTIWTCLTGERAGWQWDAGCCIFIVRFASGDWLLILQLQTVCSMKKV